MTGLSKRNLEFMQQFAFSYQILFPKQLVSEINSSAIFNIPWGYNITIFKQLIIQKSVFGMLRKQLKTPGLAMF
jgi:hypothetical protein